MQQVTEKPGGVLAADCATCGWPAELRAPGIRLPLPESVTIICPECATGTPAPGGVRHWRGSLNTPEIDAWLDETEREVYARDGAQ